MRTFAAVRRPAFVAAMRRPAFVAAMRRPAFVAFILILVGAVGPAWAQSTGPESTTLPRGLLGSEPRSPRAQAPRSQVPATPSAPGAQVRSDQPVTFTSDSVEYDRENALVTASGHVEAWQNDHVLNADKVTFDRSTGVMAATGHVVLMEPNGEILFADYAEMNQGMKDGILKDMRAILAQNGRLAANGARRTGGEVNEMADVVYSTCNLCKDDPKKPPLWQLRASKGVQDLEHKKIEYEDAVMQIYGVPVAYFPYFWHADPSVKRASGLLIPTIGLSSRLGVFFDQPYYWVIDDQSDATITPMITSNKGPELDVEYRRRFNDGTLQTNVSIGHDDGSMQGTLSTKGQFDFDDTWRWGFDINRASSANYISDFRLSQDIGTDISLLASQVYLEGFGEGAYSRLDTHFYQSVNTAITNSKLPVVLPRYEYSYFGLPDAWGGRLSIDAGAFNVFRSDGTDTRRASLTMNWERPFMGSLGDMWKLTLHNDAAAYDASAFEAQPNFGTHEQADAARALPQAALDVRWPFMRDSGSWGTQVIEPMAELIIAPRSGNSQVNRYPNEDSLDLEFSDTNLFGFNRFPGIDRLEGGSRVNLGLHTAWYLNGTVLDSLVGQSYRTFKDNLFPQNSGLYNQVSDVVARSTFAPTQWLDLTYRTRLDQATMATRMVDAFGTVGNKTFSVNAGYLYTTDNPYSFYDQPQPLPSTSAVFTPRREVTFGTTARWGDYHMSVSAQRNLQTGQMDVVTADAAYEDECFIMDMRFSRRYTSLNGDNGSTAVLLQLTFKTVGAFGFRAL